jgi:hypothetical protein
VARYLQKGNSTQLTKIASIISDTTKSFQPVLQFFKSMPKYPVIWMPMILNCPQSVAIYDSGIELCYELVGLMNAATEGYDHRRATEKSGEFHERMALSVIRSIHEHIITFRRMHVHSIYGRRNQRDSFVMDILGICPADHCIPINHGLSSMIEVWSPLYSCTASPPPVFAVIARLMERWRYRTRSRCNLSYALALQVLHPAPWLYLMSISLDEIYKKLDENTIESLKYWSEEVSMYLLQYRPSRPT